jgi:hypothetical protein
LTGKQKKIGPIPAPGWVEPYGKGVFVISTKQRFSYKNRGHNEMAFKVAERLWGQREERKSG